MTRSKKPYVRPQVIDHGDIITITRTSVLVTTVSDGGADPTFYSS